ncbi:hypothetical protein JTF08_13260, partial [Micrococcaceae bacterium RIT802]|nr:hypothetical protein [Micrococcaceae bacterium RIT 802]
MRRSFAFLQTGEVASRVVAAVQITRGQIFTLATVATVSPLGLAAEPALAAVTTATETSLGTLRLTPEATFAAIVSATETTFGTLRLTPEASLATVIA